jgi:hypothetical protein
MFMTSDTNKNGTYMMTNFSRMKQGIAVLMTFISSLKEKASKREKKGLRIF